ncbi:MAG TPA: hypothetical protein VFH31_14885 [Pyrinomonadaceae bacterium]|nr:hypothetical protein [Pyrinomonadaceae bacterium]
MDKRKIDESSSLDDEELVSMAECVFLEMDRLEVPQMDETGLTGLATLYSGFAESDSNLAEEGIRDYQRGLLLEDANDI